MKIPRQRLGRHAAVLLASVVTALAAPAHAGLPGKSGATVQVVVPSTSGFLATQADAALPVHIGSGVVQSVLGGSSGEAAVTASYGKIATSASGAAVGNELHIVAAGSGYYQDGWSVLYGGHTGEAITVTQYFDISGTLVNPRTSTDTAGSSWGLLITDEVGRFLATVDSTTADADLAYKEGVADMNATRTAGTLKWTHTFRVGEPFSFKVTLGSGVNTQSARDFAASVDFSHTVKLSAIDVYHGGQKLSDTAYTLVTASGFHYLAPVPEPSTWAMLAVGLGVVGLSTRRSKVSGSGSATS